MIEYHARLSAEPAPSFRDSCTGTGTGTRTTLTQNMRTHPSTRARSLLFLFLLLPTPTQAQTPPTFPPTFRPVSLYEGLALIPAGVALVLIETQWAPPEQPHWEGGILFDNPIRDLVVGTSRQTQKTAASVSDALFLWGSAIPILVDVGVVALGVHQDPELALQLLLINLQSLSVAGLFSLTAEHSVGRARPYYADCDSEGQVLDSSGEPLLNSCGHGGDAMSFYSGHAALTATVAGLTCVHHQYLPLYGGGFADLAPCLVTIGVSVTTGIGRMIADMHWSTDVIVGWGIGAFAGYALPRLLHYDWSSDSERAPSSMLTLLPLPGGLGFSWSGVL
jgi:membrane-associated phospholipid phosphatase